MSLSSARARFALFAIVTTAACSDATAPPQPSSVTQEQAATIEGTAGTVLAAAPTFVVKDQSGNAVGGVSVSVAVTAGGGTLTDAPTSSKNGPTSVGTWKLGNVAGVNTITVTVSGLPPLIITANGKAGPPASITVVSGNDQLALAGTALVIPPVVQVKDQFGNGVSGASVTFSVIDGEGTLASVSPVVTNATGNATAPVWTVGRSAVPQSLLASTTGNFSVLVRANVKTDYNIDLRVFGPAMPPVAEGLFRAAAARINAAVIGDLRDVAPFIPAANLESGCGVTGLPTAFSETVDDVIIYASVANIDGPGRILASAFPCGIRGADAANRQTFLGVMRFDAADIETMITLGVLGDVIQHEMLHVVGIGTLWNIYGVLAGAGTSQTRFTGTLGVGGCIAMGGTSVCPGSIPVENSGGGGTADAHWRESVFANELMTGFINTPQSTIPSPNPFSVMSIQSLGDVGYTVNPMAADPYVIPGTSAARILGQLNVDASAAVWEEVRTPKLTVSSSGRLTLVQKQ